MRFYTKYQKYYLNDDLFENTNYKYIYSYYTISNNSQLSCFKLKLVPRDVISIRIKVRR